MKAESSKRMTSTMNSFWIDQFIFIKMYAFIKFRLFEE